MMSWVMWFVCHSSCSSIVLKKGWFVICLRPLLQELTSNTLPNCRNVPTVQWGGANIQLESGREVRLGALLGAFTVFRLGDGAVPVVGVGSGFGYGGINVTAGLRWESGEVDVSGTTRSSSSFMASACKLKRWWWGRRWNPLRNE